MADPKKYVKVYKPLSTAEPLKRPDKPLLAKIDPKGTVDAMRPSTVATYWQVLRVLGKPLFAAVICLGLMISLDLIELPKGFPFDEFDPEKPVVVAAADSALPAEESTHLSSAQYEALLQKAIRKARKEVRKEPKKDSNTDELTEKISKISFIAGLIAMHRPGLEHSGEIAKHIVELSETKGVDPFFIAAVISVESRFGTSARSHKGALGLMQLMPDTARWVSRKMMGETDNPQLKEPHTNIRLGIEYLQALERRYTGNRFLALAAYNWGPGNIENIERNRARIPRSVQGYASKVLERYVAWNGHFENAEKNAATLVTKENA